MREFSSARAHQPSAALSAHLLATPHGYVTPMRLPVGQGSTEWNQPFATWLDADHRRLKGRLHQPLIPKADRTR